MININQLNRYVVTPVLKDIGLFSIAARNLVIGTAWAESHLEYIHQLGGGPAKGIFQMEPATHEDIWDNFLKYKDRIADNLVDHTNVEFPDAETMVYNLKYAAAMCRLHYLRVPKALPDAEDAKGLALYHKKYYNTVLGKADPDKTVFYFKSTINKLKGD